MIIIAIAVTSSDSIKLVTSNTSSVLSLTDFSKVTVLMVDYSIDTEFLVYRREMFFQTSVMVR